MMDEPTDFNLKGSDLAAGVVVALTLNSDPFLSCDDCFDQVDAAVESHIAENIPLTEKLAVHLRSCGVCHDEALSLAELIAEDFNFSPVDAIGRIEAAIASSIGVGRH